MDNGTEETDKLVYESIETRFRYEWDRTDAIDGKAANIISFVGIILSLEAGLGGLLIENISSRAVIYANLCIVFFLGILFLSLSILCGLKAYFVKTWKMVPEPKYLIKEYAQKGAHKLTILRVLSNGIADSIEKNKEANDEKIKYVKLGFILLVIGIIVNVLFIYGLLISNY